MTAGGTATALARASLDGCNATALAYQAGGVVEQFVGVADILYVEQLHLGVTLCVEVLVHIFQHRLDAYLLAVAY